MVRSRCAVPGNDLTNPSDGTLGATPAGVAQSVMANISNPGQDIGSTTTNAVRLGNYNGQAAPDIAFGVSGPNLSYFNNGTGTYAKLLPTWEMVTGR